MNLQRETACGWSPLPAARRSARFAFHVSPRTFRVSRFKPSPSSRHASLVTRHPSAFTLIELILVMAILTMVAAVSAPVLSRFFRGRSLDYEARRLLALAHIGQSRAASEGMPMDLWVNSEQGTYGLEAEPSFQTSDPKREEIQMDSGLTIQAVSKLAQAPATVLSRTQTPSIVSAPKANLVHPTLPTIRFLPEGTISDTSPSELILVARDGSSLRLKQSSDRLTYEIAKSDK